ncbi:MAG: formate dehydrogenase [Burkholderiales bacterium]
MSSPSADKKPSVEPAAPLKRRQWVLGVGAVGAAAVAVKALPGAMPVAPAVAVAKDLVDEGGGYRLSAHVQRYYDTAKA